MGQSPMRYKTTTGENSNGKVGLESLNSIFERKKAAHTNHITNFIDQETGGYEKSPVKNGFGKIPEKIEGGKKSNLDVLILDLKSSHFNHGHAHKANFSHVTNKIYGLNATSVKAEGVPWASRKTNFTLGNTPSVKQTDYNSRFNRYSESFSTRSTDAAKNAAKLNDSAVKISGNNEFHTNIASH